MYVYTNNVLSSHTDIVHNHIAYLICILGSIDTGLIGPLTFRGSSRT